MIGSSDVMHTNQVPVTWGGKWTTGESANSLTVKSQTSHGLVNSQIPPLIVAVNMLKITNALKALVFYSFARCVSNTNRSKQLLVEAASAS